MGNKKSAETALTTKMADNIGAIKQYSAGSSDVLYKSAEAAGFPATIVLFEGMFSDSALSDYILTPLNHLKKIDEYTPDKLFAVLTESLFISASGTVIDTVEDVYYYAASGCAVILIDGIGKAYACGVQGFKTRGIEQPTTSLNIRSSRESFTEVLRTNITLLRRRYKSPGLVFDTTTVGTATQTDVCVCYIKGKADDEIVRDIKRRIAEIPLETVLESGYIQPYLEESGNMIFSQCGITERPDCIIGKLFCGRIAVIVDGTPFVLYLPKLFNENFQTMDDYAGSPVYISFMRILKCAAYILAVLLPGFYIALANFNPELFPPSLLFNLTASVKSTPYPLMPECILINIMYEIMREAGLRLPKYIGHAVSIVGGLVIGQIAVSAGLVGAPLVLIVAMTGIASFVVPDLYDNIVVLRFSFIFAGGFWGLYGLYILGIVVLVKMCSMTNFGVPYTTPVTPFRARGMRDVFWRVPWPALAKGKASPEITKE
ncbi:spore germination protein [Clostridia bacterium]|nr:spore germination protein [Clostridia bacterium]